VQRPPRSDLSLHLFSSLTLFTQVPMLSSPNITDAYGSVPLLWFQILEPD